MVTLPSSAPSSSSLVLNITDQSDQMSDKYLNKWQIIIQSLALPCLNVPYRGVSRQMTLF